MVKSTLPAHLLDMKSLSRDQINAILKRANHFLTNYVLKNRATDTLTGKLVANLFFEPSTRTRNSFEVASKRLGAIILNPELSLSALNKGESLLDTVHTFEALGVNIAIVRHEENGVPAWLSDQVSSCTIINAGDGYHQHPTQGLIDLFTIQQHKSDWSTLTVTIVGDIFHSRVTNSLVDGLTMMGVKDIRLVGPPTLLPKKPNDDHIKVLESLEDGLTNSDVIVALRLQKERMHAEQIPDASDFQQQYCLTANKLKLAKPDAIVMHPGPINRDVEIAADVADSSQSVILQQVKNGVAVRMAVLEMFL